MPRKNMGGFRVHFIAPAPLLKRLEKATKLTGIDKSSHIRLALEVYLTALEKKHGG